MSDELARLREQEGGLLPCPFCGNNPTEHAIEAHSHSGPIKALGIPDHPGSHVVECSCGAGLIDDTREEVVARWNSRAALRDVPAPKADAEKMKIEVCKGVVGLALYVDDTRVAGVRHNGVMTAILSAVVPAPREVDQLKRTIAARDRRIDRLVWAMDYARAQGVVFPADAEPKVVLSDTALTDPQGREG